MPAERKADNLGTGITHDEVQAQVIMRIEVESDSGDSGIETPKRIRLDGRVVDIVETIDRWPGRDYYYFKVKGDDGNLYILRRDEPRNSWDLTMFQRPQAST